MMSVEIYTDGSAKGNPGPGGYGTIVRYTDPKGVVHEKEITEGFPDTTNNRMELMGVIAGLECLNRPCRVELFSDSKYVTDAFNKGWVEAWIAKGWKKADKSPVLNVDLWKRLLLRETRASCNRRSPGRRQTHPQRYQGPRSVRLTRLHVRAGSPSRSHTGRHSAATLLLYHRLIRHPRRSVQNRRRTVPAASGSFRAETRLRCRPA